jgi:tripeptidyl-peptidase-1
MIGVGIFSTVTAAVSETAFPTMHKFMSKSNLNKLKGVTHRGKAAANQYHEVIFAVKHKNLDWLKQTLEAVSYPDSPLYGKHLTRQEVADKICDPDTTKTVREYVEALGFTVQRETLYGEYIYVGGHVHQFEKLFSTSFHEYSVHNHNAKRQETLIRAEEYSIPVDLAEHVSTVFKTVQFPAPVMKLSKNLRDISLTSSGKTTPQLIDSYYCIPSNTGNSLTSQAIYAALDQTMSPADLSTFQSQYDLPQQPIAGSYGGHVSSTTCNIDPQNCTEANLDVQYIMATSQVTPTYFFYWNGTDIWLDWITTVADQANPSDIFSISYGSYEDDIPFDYLDQFDIQAQTLGTLGTTLVASVSRILFHMRNNHLL